MMYEETTRNIVSCSEGDKFRSNLLYKLSKKMNTRFNLWSSIVILILGVRTQRSFMSSFTVWGGRGVGSDGANVLGKRPMPGSWSIGASTALAVGAGGGCWDIFSLLSFLSSFSLFLGDGPI